MTKLRTMLVVVICAMAVLLTGSVAMAKDSNDTVISKVSSLGIMVGTNKGFEETKTLTRAEATAIIVRMAGYEEKEIDKYVGETNFSDVKENYWGAKYINVATSQNLVKGIGKGLFAPDREVTVAEFVTMAVRSLGAEAYVEPLGQWPANYMSFAKDEDIVGSRVNGNVTATRMDAANIIANTLEAKMWKKVSMKTTGEVEYTQGTKTLLEEVFEVEKLENVKFVKVNRVKETITLGIKTYDYSCTLPSLMANVKVNAWVRDDKVIRVEIADDCDYVAFTGISKVDAKEKEITLIVNGEEKVFDYDRVNVSDDDITISGVVKVEDDKVTKIETVSYQLYKVTGKTSKKIKLDGKTLAIDDDHYYEVINEEGNNIDISDLEKDDYVLVGNLKNDGKEVSVKVVEQLTGKITAKGEGYVRIDGVKYKLNVNAPALTLNKKVTVSLFNGRIIGKEDVNITTDFAMVVSIEEVNEDDYNAIYEVILKGGSVVELKGKNKNLVKGNFYSMDIEDDEIVKAEELGTREAKGIVMDLDEDDDITIGDATYNFEDDYFVIDEENEIVDLDVEFEEDEVTLVICNDKVICIKVK